MILRVSSFPACTVLPDAKSVIYSDTYRFGRYERVSSALTHIVSEGTIYIIYICRVDTEAYTFSIQMASYDKQRTFGFNMYRSPAILRVSHNICLHDSESMDGFDRYRFARRKAYRGFRHMPLSTMP